MGNNGQRRLVIDVSELAIKQGVSPGMTLAEGRALCPELACIEHDPAADLRALEALGRWLTCFTPFVATGWRDDSSEMPAVLFLDLTGSERLFGSNQQLTQRVAKAIERFGIPFRIAVAPTAGAAWAVASGSNESGQVISENQLHAVLSPLPLTTLRLHPNIMASLHHLGMRTIGELLALPREQLPVRFGPTLLLRIDQAFGNRPEPLEPLSYEAPIAARVDLESPVAAQETIWMVFQAMLRQVIADLTRRGRGARQIDLMCKSDITWKRPDVVKSVHLTRPSRDLKSLFNLIRCATEQLNGGEEGFVAFRMNVPLHERISDTQPGFFGIESDQDWIEFERLIERLRARLGEFTVIRPMFVESYLPERAWKPQSDISTVVKTRVKKTDAGSEVRRRAGSFDRSGSSEYLRTGVERLMHNSRPLHVLPTPAEIQVISEPFDPSDASIGRPRQFTWNRRIYQLKVVVGPERIAGEWWRGHRRTRDYYEVEETTGLRFWLFRVVRQIPVQGDELGLYQLRVRWFVHGRYG